ncbi:hypothetical protein CGJ90_21550 [Vibrio parahaemolyticus]|nr:hypothetical protein CGJ90_21550 [Vibrio parahaemolyticus]TOG16009.1 hypothetical protein CGJ06_24480 [Vibrio parahaemolyticus]
MIMTGRFTEFLVCPSGKSPKNLKDSIRRIQNSSLGFRESWLSGEHDDALKTSEEAFEHLDYVQNEFLRQRDVHKMDAATWSSSPFKTELGSHVGNLINGISVSDSNLFISQAIGSAHLPSGTTTQPLTLEKALNKLKHRDTVKINFSLPELGGHKLYILTNGGMGQPASLSEIDMNIFCSVCKAASEYV